MRSLYPLPLLTEVQFAQPFLLPVFLAALSAGFAFNVHVIIVSNMYLPSG
jgi:hypothetical protein